MSEKQVPTICPTIKKPLVNAAFLMVLNLLTICEDISSLFVGCSFTVMLCVFRSVPDPLFPDVDHLWDSPAVHGAVSRTMDTERTYRSTAENMSILCWSVAEMGAGDGGREEV